MRSFKAATTGARLSIRDGRTGKSTMVPEVQFERKMIDGNLNMENTGHIRPPRAFSPGSQLLAVVPRTEPLARSVQIWDLDVC